jgi:hypothetical protein
MAAGIPLVETGVTDPPRALWHNFTMLLDGYGWKPLSHEDDYLEVGRRVWKELFAADYSQYSPGWIMPAEPLPP